MVSPIRARRAFTLVELLVVIGIIAVLIGILLPVIGRARRQADTVACSATLRMIGQTLYIYASENRGSLPYGFYRSDVFSSPDPNAVDGADPSTTVFVWWSVLRSYQRRGANSDNSALNSGNSVSTRGMKGMTCPNALGTPGTISYAPNMVAMPDRQFEMHPFNASATNGLLKPARLTQLYPDNILFWDVTEIHGTGPSFGSQYVVGYEVDAESLINPKQAYKRYRTMAGPPLIANGSALSNEVFINPGSNKDTVLGQDDGQKGNIRWRHGNNDTANFLFADGTVRSMKITSGTFGQPNFRGEVLRKFLRIKPAGAAKLTG